MDAWHIKEKHNARGRCQNVQNSVTVVIHFKVIQDQEPKEAEWNLKSTLGTLNISKFNWEANSIQFNMYCLRASHVSGPILNNWYIPIAIYTYLSITYLSINRLIDWSMDLSIHYALGSLPLCKELKLYTRYTIGLRGLERWGESLFLLRKGEKDFSQPKQSNCKRFKCFRRLSSLFRWRKWKSESQSEPPTIMPEGIYKGC